MLYNGREPHSDIHLGKTDTLGFIIPETFLSSLFDHIDITPKSIEFHKCRFPPNSLMKKKLSSILSLRGSREVSKFTTEIVVADLLIKIFNSFEHTFTKKLKSSISTGHFPHCVDRAKKHLYENMLNPEFSLNTLATLSGISKFHLLRSFKRKVGITPMQYRNQLRLDYAKAALVSEKTSITEIAYRTGFTDISTFNKAFKTNTGISPSIYRNTPMI